MNPLRPPWEAKPAAASAPATVVRREVFDTETAQRREIERLAAEGEIRNSAATPAIPTGQMSYPLGSGILFDIGFGGTLFGGLCLLLGWSLELSLTLTLIGTAIFTIPELKKAPSGPKPFGERWLRGLLVGTALTAGICINLELHARRKALATGPFLWEDFAILAGIVLLVSLPVAIFRKR